MSAIAQRRVAGATALMILLYLLQVALFTPTAGADQGNPPSVECASADPEWNGKHYKIQVNDGALGSVDPESSGSITITGNDEDGWTWTNSDTDTVFRVVYKAGASGSDLVVSGSWETGEGAELDLSRTGLSHVTWCFTAPDAPDSPSFTVGVCDERTGLRPVTFTVDANSEVVIDGVDAAPDDENEAAFQPGSHEIDLPEGTYTWRLFSPINTGTQIDGDTFAVGPCEQIPETFGGDLSVEKVVVISSGTPVTTSFGFTVTDEDAFSLADGESEFFSYTLETAEDSVVVTITEDAITETGWTTSVSCTDESVGTNSVQVTVGDSDDITCTFTNTYREPTTTTTQATTTTTTQATSTSTEATTTTTNDEVLGTTVTTVPEVSADTLPFTGSESGDFAKLGLLALVAGALMLFAVRGPKEEEEIATEMGGWSSL